MAFLNVNTPLKNLKTGDYFYPLTNLDQIITGNNRLSAFMSENNNLLNLNNIGNISANTITVNNNITAINGIISNYVTIGSNSLNTDYKLYVDGASYLKGNNFTRDIYHYNSNAVRDGAWVTDRTGTAGDGTNNGSTGVNRLYLGNATAVATSGGANNSQGFLRIYGDGTGYSDVTVQNNTWLYPSSGLSLPNNCSGLVFRGNYHEYITRFSYQTDGNEALVMATQNAVTSFIFVNGEAQSNDSTSNRWRSLTPGLQIKNNCVSIGTLIADGSTPSYKLYVNGSTYINGASYFNGNLDVRYNNFITFYGKNNNTSPMARMGYMSAISGGACHSISTSGGYQTSGAFYIWSNGCDAGNDNGGIAIDNEGVTVFGAGDAASNFTGVFRVINEDNIAAGPVFRVQKDGKAYATALYGAVWNDFAEYRAAATEEPGRVVCSDSSGIMQLSTYRLQPAGHIVSDTFGCSVGRADGANTPIGVAGRVLVYPYENRDEYQIGDAVCAAPNGTVSKMTREEIIKYPDRIIGIVDEVPKYEYWIQKLTKKGNGQPIAKVKVSGRIWVYVR